MTKKKSIEQNNVPANAGSAEYERGIEQTGKNLQPPACNTDLHLDEYGFDTVAVRSAQVRTAEGEHSDPIFLTSSFVYESAEQAAASFSETAGANVYSRFTNPTVRSFERRLAAMEGGKWGIGASSGMAAITNLCLAQLRQGDHVVAARNLFGSTIGLLQNIFSKFGVTTTFVSATDLQGWRDAITPNTKLLFAESPTNPLGEIVDIQALSEIARASDAKLVIDNCFCTPALQQPLLLGADIVMHTATKYIDGQGRCLGGALVMNDEEIYKNIFNILRTSGACMSPFNAWIFLHGLETLNLRMQKHCDNAERLATWLANHENVEQVYYPGLKSHTNHTVACRQQSRFGGVVSFKVKGDKQNAYDIINATKILSVTGNLGDTKTTIVHPASTTHSRLSEEQRMAAGISDNLIRVSAGVENSDDIIADIAIGLDKI